MFPFLGGLNGDDFFPSDDELDLAEELMGDSDGSCDSCGADATAVHGHLLLCRDCLRRHTTTKPTETARRTDK